MTYWLGGEHKPSIDEFLHMSTKPWSDYSESDYTPEQWHRACLIHQHDGAPTAKSQCKLPIRTPDGAVNKNAIFAAAAALAGARTPMNASSEQKAKAARTLIRLYSEMGQEPPKSLLQFSHVDDVAELMHYGVKGMRWGVRRSDEELGRSKKGDDKTEKKSSSASKSSASGKKDSESEFSEKQWQDAVKKAAPKHATPEDKAKAVEADKKLFVNKFKPSGDYDADSVKKDEGNYFSRLSTAEKVKLGVGAAATVGILGYMGYASYQYKKNYDPGEEISPFAFVMQVAKSQQASWGGDYLKDPSVWQQPEVRFPAGHTFHRISGGAETSFGKATYSTASMEDYTRYIFGFANTEKGSAVGMHHVTFKAKEEIRVPTLAQRLAAVHTSMQRDYPEKKWTAQEAADQYGKWIGKSWESPGAQSFFKVLKEQGFDAIVDDMDAGVIGEIPLVIFNHDKFTSKSSTVITSDEVKKLGKKLTEIPNRKK